MIKYYVEYYFPGVFFPETDIKEIPFRSVGWINFPKNSYAARIFEREEIDGETGKLFGSSKNWSAMYFNGGEVYDKARLLKEYPNEKILICNCGDGYVIRTPLGNWQPYNPKEDVIFNAEHD